MMRERLQKWADYFGGIGVALLVAAGIMFVIGNQPRERLLVLVGASVIFFGLYVYARSTQVREAVTGRGVRYGSNALLISAAFIGIVALLNFIGTRYSQRFDWTAGKSQTLSSETIKVVESLKEPVKAIAFYTTLRANPQDRTDAEDRLKEYRRYSDKFTYQMVDPQADPQLAFDYKVQVDNTIVLERGTRRENVFNSDEQSLTNALLKVSQDIQPTIYFTTGHGEHNPEDSGDNGYSSMKQAMEAENYKVAVLNLRTVTETLPSDLTALIIAGPRQKFDPEEVKRVQDYLDKNGRAIILVDPQTETGLESLLKTWGVTFRNDVVVDPKQGLFGRALLPVIQSYKSHAITQEMSGRTTFFPNTRSLSSDSPAPAGKTATALFATSDASWGETDFDSVRNQNPAFDVNKEVKGPLDLAYAVEGIGTNPPRLVVLGNSTFITNGTFKNVQGTDNGPLFGNMLRWLAGQENLIAIPPKTTDRSPIFLTAEQSNFVFFSSFLMLPAAILLVGGIIWWRRR